MAPTISIIMPCYNCADTVRASVESVDGQVYRDFELIVIDDGSTDQSRNVLKSLSRDRPWMHVLQQPNQGASSARNRGLRQARGKYVAFLDSDDTWSPDFLQQMQQALVSYPGTSLAYCGWQNLGVTGGRGEPFIPPDYENTDKVETFLRGCRWPIHACLSTREAIMEAGLFNESLISSEDFELWLKIATTHRIILVPEVLAFYHHHDGEQLTKNRLQLALDHLTAQKNFLRENPKIAQQLGKKKIRDILYGELENRAFESFWGDDPEAGLTLFRVLLSVGYINGKNMKYLVASILPPPLLKGILRTKHGEKAPSA